MMVMRSRRFWGLLVLLGSFMVWAWPTAAQLPGPDGGAGPPETLMRITVADLTIQGEVPAAAVREALTPLPPPVLACLESELGRHGKLPARITLRFNLSGGRVVWSKLIDPPWKTLDACLARALAGVKLPSAGSGLSRATLVLECRTDHLLAP